MRRGYRNRWEYDNFPDAGNASTKNGSVSVNPTTGLWHNVEPIRSQGSNTQSKSTLAKLREFGWIK